MTETIDDSREVIQIALNGHVELYMLKKTFSVKAEKSREIFRADVDGEVAQLYRKIIVNKIKYLTENVIVDFFDEKPVAKYISMIDNYETVPILSSAIDRIVRREESCKSITNLDKKTLDQLHSYAVKFATQDDAAVIYFRKYGRGYKFGKKLATLVFYRGKFDKIDGDVFKCDNDVDGVYYKKSDKSKIYIFNDANFEDIFSFYEIYQEESKTAFEILSNSGFVQLEAGLFNEIKNKSRYIKKIANLNKKGYFDSLDFEKMQLIRSKVKNLNFSVSENEITIQTKAALRDFLDICEKNILQDLLDEDMHYRVPKKEKL